MSEAARELGEAAIVLSSRYEQRLLQPSNGCAGARAVPAVVITGFLGSGKTTLVTHLLEAAGRDLRIAVLVNEVGDVDIDSLLVNARQRNAAAGVRPADLSGGCACCAVAGALDAALRELAGSSAYADLDYLLIETSGAADASALAGALSGSGFILDLVVCVVDAEAGAALLEAAEREEREAGAGGGGGGGGGGGDGSGGVALAQLRAADLVILNKVDLASMGAVSDLEDAVRRVNPRARLLRCRFGRLGPEALLDMGAAGWGRGGAEGEQQQQQQQQQQQRSTGPGAGPDALTPPSAGRVDGDGSASSGSGAAPQRIVGEVGFLSHEGPVAAQPARPHAQPRVRRLPQQRPAPAAPGAGQRGHPRHAGYETVSAVVEDAPLCMACFRHWVAERLLATPGLLRAKGVAWLAQRRGSRFVFHVSGRQRAECVAEGAWEGPAATRIILIGQRREAPPPAARAAPGTPLTAHARPTPAIAGAPAAMEPPADAGGCSQHTASCGHAGRHGQQGQGERQQSSDDGSSSPLQRLASSLVEGCVWGRCGCGPSTPQGSPDSPAERPHAAAAEFARLAAAHPRLRALPAEPSPAPSASAAGAEAAAAACGGGGAGAACRGLVAVSAEAVPLHGIVAEQVNAQLLRLANAAAADGTPGPAFLCATGCAAPLSALTGLAAAERPVAELLAAFRPQEGAAAGAAAWGALAGESGAGRALRRAYAHATSCKCDVVAEMQAASS